MRLFPCSAVRPRLDVFRGPWDPFRRGKFDAQAHALQPQVQVRGVYLRFAAPVTLWQWDWIPAGEQSAPGGASFGRQVTPEGGPLTSRIGDQARSAELHGPLEGDAAVSVTNPDTLVKSLPLVCLPPVRGTHAQPMPFFCLCHSPMHSQVTVAQGPYPLAVSVPHVHVPPVVSVMQSSCPLLVSGAVVTALILSCVINMPPLFGALPFCCSAVGAPAGATVREPRAQRRGFPGFWLVSLFGKGWHVPSLGPFRCKVGETQHPGVMKGGGAFSVGG